MGGEVKVFQKEIRRGKIVGILYLYNNSNIFINFISVY